MMHAPKASFGLPVYNGQDYLAEALDSMLAQDFVDFEIVISDNFSTDRTQEICEDYASRDSRIKYHRLDKNYGAAYNYNRVFELSTGKYFKWATHDDVILPTFLSRCIAVLEQHEYNIPQPAMVYPKSVFIDEQSNIIGPDQCRVNTLSPFPAIRTFHILQQLGMATPIFGLIPRSILKETRLIDNFISSDYALILEAGIIGSVIQFDDVLFMRRIHPGMSRLANTKMKDVLTWFDPNATQRMPPSLRLFLEYQKSIWRLPKLPAHTRIACSISVLVSMIIKRLRVIQGRYRKKLVSKVRELVS